MPIDCAIDLRRGSSGDWKRTSATNISMSGMFLRTAEMHPSGSILDVKFELHNGQPAIRAQVEVLWSRARDSGPEAPQGLGVRFRDLDLESKYAISRLVDRYQQLGRMPFHLAAVEDEPPASGHARWGRHSALALAFLAGTVAGAAGSLWLVARSESGGETAGIAQASELTPKTTRPALPAKASPESSPTPAVEPAGNVAVTPAENPATAVAAAVEAWARAWAAKDVERYLAAYSASFQPASGRSLETWRTERRERLSRPGAVEIGVSALQVEVLGPDRAIARFDQAYAAPGYRDRVRKQLELLKREQGWRVLREDILEELPITERAGTGPE